MAPPREVLAAWWMPRRLDRLIAQAELEAPATV
jgi:hypothetical protein